MRRLVAALALLCALATPAAADFTVRGKFLYRDRTFDDGGFTGADTDKPIRLADVQVLDSSNNVLASGATGNDGTFSILVTDSQTHDIYMRVMTKADNTPAFRARVVRSTDSAVFALATSIYAAHNPSVDIDFRSSTIGEPFNIFDQALDAFDFIAARNGARPTRLLTLRWAHLSNDGTYYNHGDASIHLVGLSNDSDGYDDTVILHEIGHYTEFNIADSDNPGGSHSLNGYYDLRLTWSEGWATFFANMVRSWRGFDRPDIYVDTAGQPGPGQAFISYDVEAPGVGRPGSNNEVTVNALLWDVVDNQASQDASPGSEDDPLELANGQAEFWDVFVNSIKFASSITMEDFWDGWFTRNHGREADMRTVFGGRAVEYFPDSFENDGTVGLAKTVVAGGSSQHHTTYGAGDQDWFVIGVVGASSYVFETTDLLSGADTRLELYTANGSTLLGSNDDRTSGDPSSRISYTPPADGVVYLKCTRRADQHTYGSWDLLVSGIPVGVEISDVAVESGPEGVLLRFRARTDGAFARFEVERGAGSLGPWTVLGTVQRSSPEAFEYLDRDVALGMRPYYRIVGIDVNGTRQVFGPWAPESVLPVRLVLRAPHPNPFNPTTTVDFDLPRDTRAWLRVYAADGRLVRTLVEGETLPQGRRRVLWDGRDTRGKVASSGVYWFRLDAGGESRTQRGVLVR
jgi:hypothetical protein